MSTDAVTAAAPAKKKSSIGKILICFLVILAAWGAYNWHQNQLVEEDRQRLARNLVAIEEAGIRNQEAAKEQAMLAGKAVAGMSKYEVLKSMGQPEDVQRTADVSDEDRRAALMRLHTFEVLNYYSKGQAVYIDAEGNVVAVHGYKN